jgi:hypothetical protein
MIAREYKSTKGRFMKPVLKLLIASLVLLTQGFAQEPKKAIVPHDSGVVQSRDQITATGSAKQPAPEVQPKALPTLSPSLGDIARAARAAHAAAPKAQVVVAEDTPQQK